MDPRSETQKELTRNIFQALQEGRIEDLDNLKFPSPNDKARCFKEYRECVNWDDPDNLQDGYCEQQLQSCLYEDWGMGFKDALLVALLTHYRHTRQSIAK